ncbi:MAG: PP2C family protein-serine/threonine phosphatase [Candidatus Sericytochromatia bacterium]|nr:PP2C family protein-serine/threonine phosphatase [Candidatus Sericytochromatia bacterium]
MRATTAQALSLIGLVLVCVLALVLDLSVIVRQFGWLDSRAHAGFELTETMGIRHPVQPELIKDVPRDARFLTKVDGMEVKRPWDAQAILDEAAPGSEHQLILGDDPAKPYAVMVTVRKWSMGDVAKGVLPLLGLSLICVGAAVVTYRLARTIEAGVALQMLLVGLMAVLGLPRLGLTEGTSPATLLLASVPWVAAALGHLVLVYPSPPRVLKDLPIARIVPYLAALVLSLLALGMLGSAREGKATDLVWTLSVVGVLVWGPVLAGMAWMGRFLYQVSLESSLPGARGQARQMLQALVSAALPLATFGLLSLFSEAGGIDLGVALSLPLLGVFPLATAAVIARVRPAWLQERLETATVIVATGVALLLIYAPVAGIAGWLGRSLGADLGYDLVTAHLVATLLVVPACPWLLQKMRELMDVVFERKRADTALITDEFTISIRNLTKHEPLYQALLAQCEKAFQPRYLMAFTKDSGDTALMPRRVLGVSSDRVKPLRLDEPGLPRYVGAYSPRGIEAGRGGDTKQKGLSLVIRPEQGKPPVAVVVVGPRRSGEPWLPDDTELLARLGDQLQIGLDRIGLIGQVADQEKLRHEMEIARQVQLGLLPKKMPVVAGAEVFGSSTPALEVGGDLYDVVAFDDGRLGMLIGDVSGKGMPAALLMTTALSCFRTSVKSHDSPAEMLSRMNEIICANKPAEGMFVAVCYAIWEPSGRMLLANGGMPRPLQNGDEIVAKGPPLGMMNGYKYREIEVSLKVGDTLLFYSDGLEDIHSPQGATYGVDRIFANARAARDGAAALLHQFTEEITNFRQERAPFDDVTMVTMRMLAKPLAAPAMPAPAAVPASGAPAS